MTDAMPAERVRLDKWLWAARFFKTRSLAADEISRGRVHINGQAAKASREVRIGDTIDLRQGSVARCVMVQGVDGRRGSAPLAQALYEETAQSIEQRAAQHAARQLNPEPAAAIAGGRPTKRDRRELGDWNRWSASIDGD